MAHYIDADKLIAEIERKRDSALERQKNLEKIGQETVLNEMIAFELNRLISFVVSLQQEQPKFNIPSAGSGAWGTTPPKFKLDVKSVEQEVDLKKEIDKKWRECCSIDEGMGDEKAILVIEQFHQIARHFAEWGAKQVKSND